MFYNINIYIKISFIFWQINIFYFTAPKFEEFTLILTEFLKLSIVENYTPDKLDYKILALISNNARISFLEVARICDVSGAAVHQRVQRLINTNVITGSSFTLNTQKMGFETCAFVSLYFDQSVDIMKISDEIEKIPEITECHHTTGAYDLLVKIYAHDNGHLHEIMQKKLRPLGMIRSESVISYRESFCRQIIVK